ncbi:MAG: YesL family protein [Lachnospiraceae bacterium]|nr:YesL family protein [Candidatus Colinaster equi]
MGVFSFDSPFMNFLHKACEYLIVTLLCMVCCIPVITAGAALTAKYYVGMKMVRGEEPAICRSFFGSFKENFGQATIIWLIELVVGAFLTYDWYLIYSIGGENFNQILKILLIVISVYLVMAAIAVFPLIARFKMSNKEAIKAALVYTYINVPRLLFVLVLLFVPIWLCFKYPQWMIAVYPVGAAVCLYIISFNFMKSFKKLENKLQGEEEEVK